MGVTGDGWGHIHNNYRYLYAERREVQLTTAEGVMADYLSYVFSGVVLVGGVMGFVKAGKITEMAAHARRLTQMSRDHDPTLLPCR